MQHGNGRYTARASGRKSFAGLGKRLMSRLVVALVVTVVIVVGGMVMLAGRAHEKPTARMEKAVDLANLQG